MKSQAELVVEYAAGQGATLPEMSSLFTNEFVGRVKLSEEQLKRARAAVEPFRKYVA